MALPAPPARPPAVALARTVRGPDRLLPLGLAVAGGLLVAGLTVPIMAIDRFFLFETQITLLDAIGRLWGAGEIGLAVLIAAFSVVFPVFKLSAAGWIWFAADPRAQGFAGRLRVLETLGRWSMLDVFVVALTVVAIELSLVAAAATLPGLWLFAGAVLVSMALTARIQAVARRAVTEPR